MSRQATSGQATGSLRPSWLGKQPQNRVPHGTDGFEGHTLLDDIPHLDSPGVLTCS